MGKKARVLVIAFIIIYIAAGCSKQYGSTSKKEQVMSVYSNMSPGEILDKVFSALKAADGKTFNDCVVYPGEKHKNVYFGDNLSDDDGYIAALFDGLTYKVMGEERGEDTAVISCEVTNKNLENIDMFAYSEEDNPLVAAIKNSSSGFTTENLDINFSWIDNQWKILIDDHFTAAISGGHW